MSASEVSLSLVPVSSAQVCAGWSSTLVVTPNICWERLSDGGGIARWRIQTASPLSSRILASREDGLMVVILEGRTWSASSLQELAEGLRTTFAQVDLDTYLALLDPLRAAWSYLGHTVAEVTPATSVYLRRVVTRWDELEQEVG